MKMPREHARRGHAIVELSLMVPWIFFLFVGAFDMGFYAYSLISVQNAARVAAITTARNTGTAGSQTEACEIVYDELARLPNANEFSTTCGGAPLLVRAESGTETEDPSKIFSRVTVQYETVQLVPIPGLLTGKTTITRIAESRVYGRNRTR
jgi:Flp pilus assembly protein TadG